MDERRGGLPAGAEAAIDRLTDYLGAGAFEKIYEEAAEEWRRDASPEQNREMLERLRTRLGRVQNRARRTGREQQYASGRLSGHTLEVVYETTFERGSGVEIFTLVEREGRWLLAGYNVSSEALK